MVGIQFQVKQDEESATNEPASNAEVTQHDPQTLPSWTNWLIVAAAAFTIYSFIKKG